MSETTQENRLMVLTTPLGEDFLLINNLTGTEEISSLYSFDIELLHDEGDERTFIPHFIDPTSILGQAVAVDIGQRDGTTRMLSGMINSFSQRQRDKRFTYYQATMVPYVWVLTQRSQSRIFQHKNVPDILKEIFTNFAVSYEMQEGKYKPRNYCVQYRETDFDFASRLMEEEGIYYFFEHKDGKNKMVIADTPQSHPDCPSKHEIPFALKVTSEEDFISSIGEWQDDYRLQTGKVSFRDFNFELPANKLSAEQPSLFKVAENEKLEVYDYPGRYAIRFDDIDRSGGERSDVQNVFDDKTRKAEVVMQSLDAQYRVITGKADCSAMTAGHRFKFFDHPNNFQNGLYVITSVRHEIKQNPMYESEEPVDVPYLNHFTCIAQGERNPPFRPLQKTRKPIIHGSQTAIVVGPAGEEIFTDKFGRVKVQFHWDRQGEDNADSSCWVRVSQAWAGNRWGMMVIPRIGMEVIVHFLEGDPDQPIITGCVYNAQTMPPYTLPDEKTKMTIKSDSSKGGGGFNEMRFEDKKGEEDIFFHAQKDMDIRVRNDRRELIGDDRHLIVYRDKRDWIKRDEHRKIERDLIEKIERDYNLTILGKVSTAVQKDVSNDYSANLDESIGSAYSLYVKDNYSLSAGQIVLAAEPGITLKVGLNFITINPGGIFIKGTMVMINSGGTALSSDETVNLTPLEPEEAHIAKNADPGSKSPTYKNQKQQMLPWKKLSFIAPTHKPNHPSNKDKKHWIEINLVDEQGNPVAGQRYRITLPDGSTLAEGTLDSKGKAKVTNIDPGNCKVTFPNLDQDLWTEA